MPRFAANLTMMYTEHAFLDRFAAAARDGFTAVEFLFPYDHPAATLAALLKDNGLKQVLFNAPPGDFAAGERGLTAKPGRESEFRDGFLHALEYAPTLSCPRIHAMAGLISPGPAVPRTERVQMRATYVSNLAWAAAQAQLANIEVLIEPIADRNIPGYFLNLQQDAHDLVAEIGAPNLKVQMDLFHVQVAEGDLAIRLRKYLADPAHTHVAHMQIAGVPERHEPDTGEVAYDYLFDLIDELGYQGWIGCEYAPKASTSEGLAWFQKWKMI